MIIQEENKDNILTVNDNFASLLQINTTEGFSTYRINYKINTNKALNQNSSMVKISIYNKTISSDIPLFLGTQTNFELVDNFGQVGKVGNETLVSSILLHTPRCKDLFLYNTNSPIVSIFSDFTKKINNEGLSGFQSARGSFDRIVKVLTTQNANSLNTKNQNTPIHEYSSKPSSVGSSVPTRASSINLIFNKGIEPFAFIDSSFGGRITTNKSLSGATQNVGPELTKEEQNLSVNVAGSNVVNTPGQIGFADQVPVVIKTTTENINIQEILRIPTGNGIDTADLFVKFDLINSQKKIIQSTTKTIKHSLNFENYLNPVLPPKLQVQKQNIFSNLITIKQEDNVANKIKIFKKQIRINNPMPILEDYKLVREVILLPNEPVINFVDNNDNSIATIYRAISYHNERYSSVFSSQLVPPLAKKETTKSIKSNSIVINSSVVSNGISINVDNISKDALNAKLVRKDLTIKEQDFKMVRNEHSVGLNGNSSISFVDINTKNEHIYEYKVIITNRFGMEYLSSSSAIEEYYKLSENTSDLNLSLPKINNTGKFDVKFDIETQIKKTNLDILKEFAIKNDIFDLFEDDIKNERDTLTGIITHNIERQNLTTGEKESLGVFSGKNFSDSAISKKIGAKSIKKENTYKYIISTQLRDPETIFENLKKTKVDEASGRKYVHNPFKFRNPITLRKGNLVTKDSLNLNYAKSTFELGNLNNQKEIIVSAASELPTVVFASASSVKNKFFGKTSNEIRWKVNGDISKIDHFILTYKILEQIYFASRVHALVNTSLFVYDHILNLNDVGKFVYVITPIYNDYTQGNSTETNGVIV